jgi:hypothetical protein
MSKETNTKEFFTPRESLQKNDVNRHDRDIKNSKTTLLGCTYSSIMEEVTE